MLLSIAYQFCLNLSETFSQLRVSAGSYKSACMAGIAILFFGIAISSAGGSESEPRHPYSQPGVRRLADPCTASFILRGVILHFIFFNIASNSNLMGSSHKPGSPPPPSPPFLPDLIPRPSSVCPPPFILSLPIPLFVPEIESLELQQQAERQRQSRPPNLREERRRSSRSFTRKVWGNLLHVSLAH